MAIRDSEFRRDLVAIRESSAWPPHLVLATAWVLVGSAFALVVFRVARMIGCLVGI